MFEGMTVDEIEVSAREMLENEFRAVANSDDEWHYALSMIREIQSYCGLFSFEVVNGFDELQDWHCDDPAKLLDLMRKNRLSFDAPFYIWDDNGIRNAIDTDVQDVLDVHTEEVVNYLWENYDYMGYPDSAWNELNDILCEAKYAIEDDEEEE